jgi:diguanylate cyclase (GGDEF)-like protein
MSNHEITEDIRVEILAVKERYKKRLLEERLSLTTLAKALNTSNLDQSAEQIHTILHSIAGSAGTFGFNEITREARRVDEAVNQSKCQLAKFDPNELVALIRKEIIGFCQTLSETESRSVGSGSQSNADGQHVRKKSVSEHPLKNEVWLIEENEQLATQFSKQLITFNFNIRNVTLNEANQLAKKDGWPIATIIDLDSKLFNDATDFKALFAETEKLPQGVIMLSDNDAFEQRIKAAKARAASFLKKPIDLTELINHLEVVFGEESSEVPRVMLVDDDDELRSLTKLELEAEGMNVHVLRDMTNILWELNEFRPELLLLDMEMPDYSGIDIALLIRQSAQFESLPIVYLSAERDLAKQTEALLFNADDFLVKPISSDRLISSIRSRIMRARKIEKLISKDGLTGLFKHAAIKEQAKRELKRAIRRNEPLSLIMLDIDFFKRVNDTYGHATGDNVIASLATLLRHRLRQTDIVGRYGGEEFLIALPSTSEQTAFDVMEKIRVAFSEIQFSSGTETFNCTLSAGCVCSNDISTNDASELIEEADRALYVSKRSGRNRQTLASSL